MGDIAGVLLTANDSSPLITPGVVYEAAGGKK